MVKFNIEGISFVGELNETDDSLHAFADDVLTDEEFASIVEYVEKEGSAIVTRDGRGALLSIEDGASDWLEVILDQEEGGDTD